MALGDWLELVTTRPTARNMVLSESAPLWDNVHHGPVIAIPSKMARCDAMRFREPGLPWIRALELTF